MKRLLIVVALGGAVLGLTPAAHAQTDTTRTTAKPQLNTAPPGAKPQLNTAPPGTTAPRPTQQPTERPAVPVPAPPPVNEPLPPARPSTSSPSGLEFPAGSRASEQPKPIRKFFLYSNFGLGYNSNGDVSQFNLSLAPAIGYRVTDRFSIGPGISYSYTNYGFSQYLQQRGYPKNITSNNLGGKVFAQYMLLQDIGIFLHAEYEVTRAEYPDVDASGTQLITRSTIVQTPLAGAGYRQQLGERAAADISLLYNFNDGINDIYGQPVIRFSFLFDLK
ncbi:hypothetical protein E5K00_04490 [Hymenobacter aquaticus]|uniref:Outer membrane protein beta-barrel domain-containing protein n=1 Tax=Hymenobacter aquaticus TaxID=1867101 RepID=A0A4Z0Q4R2_9BACT|nr:hypothetical protein [Hymenobacter aquaticus]TGE24479.1 hypothetical protein E5K00_04490 [Hymenobacter aquaticus]